MGKTMDPGNGKPEKEEPLDYDPHVFAVMTIVHELRQMMVKAVRELAEKANLTERNLWILDAVYRGTNRPLQLAQIIDVLPSTITMETSKLAEAGLVVRTKLPGGGKVVAIELTPAGQAIQQALILALNDLLEPSVAGLPIDERAAFISIGRKITAAAGRIA